MKKFILTILLLFLCLTGCGNEDSRSEDIVILFTNDIHCGIDENITLAGVKGYKEYLETKNKYVTLVDCGDAIQGSSLGMVSSGEVIIDAMNEVGYDICAFGNHEFDYGLDQLVSLINKANAKYLCANFIYTGTKENKFEDLIKPYEILTYGKTKVGFISVVTPTTIIESRSVLFKEDDEYVYDFVYDSQEFYNLIQNYVDEVKQKGADYVILLAHCGIQAIGDVYEYMSNEIINNTNGIDVLLDGHSHSTYIRHCTENKDGDYVISAQTGTKLSSLGQLNISQDGSISISLVDDITRVDEESKAIIDQYIESYSTLLNEVVTHTDFDLSIEDEKGVRMVRATETNIGDFVSDAYRYVTDADIGYTNGGSIRTNIKAGDVTMSDVISVTPFGNGICLVEVTGQEILDMLEYFSQNVQSSYTDGKGNSLGEFGSFACVSGLKYSVDTSIPASLTVDDKDNLISVDGQRRVHDVLVLENDKYVPIDINKTYKLATTDYVATQGGSGMEVFLKDHNIFAENVMLDYESLIYYLKDVLNGDVSQYQEIGDRITIK